METKHTKGEWEIEGECKNQIRCKDNHVLANVNPLHVYGKDEACANTKLISEQERKDINRLYLFFSKPRQNIRVG